MHLEPRQASTPGAAATMSTAASDPVATSAAAESSAADTQPTSVQESATSAAADPTSDSGNDSSAAQTSAAATQDDSSSAQETQPAATSSAAAATTENSQPTTSENSQPASTSEAAAPSETSSEDSSSDDSQPTTAEDSSSEAPRSTVITVTSSGEARTTVVLVTYSTTSVPASGTQESTSSTSTSGSGSIDSGGSSSGGLSQGGKVAIGVVVPIAAIAIIAVVALFFWKKRRSRKEAEEERRKEVEDYAYNPNNDPTIPSVLGDGYEMREDGSSGYRGWGSTTINSAGRKASTTMSGGQQTAGTYSDVTSPTTRGNMSDGQSNDPLMSGSYSPEGEILGAMGPNASNNRGADVHRGPSNASSSYSAARSDGSDPMGASYGGNGYYDQYAQNNPYTDGYNGQPPNAPVIRDNAARRTTRIENPSHYPQQSAGISQNF